MDAIPSSYYALQAGDAGSIARPDPVGPKKSSHVLNVNGNAIKPRMIGWKLVLGIRSWSISINAYS